jgi:hypothetical protein
MNHEHLKEVSAGIATAGSWAIWGLSLTQLNQFLTTISLIAAITASIAATIYYLTNRKK